VEINLSNCPRHQPLNRDEADAKLGLQQAISPLADNKTYFTAAEA